MKWREDYVDAFATHVVDFITHQELTWTLEIIIGSEFWMLLSVTENEIVWIQVYGTRTWSFTRIPEATQ